MLRSCFLTGKVLWTLMLEEGVIKRKGKKCTEDKGGKEEEIVSSYNNNRIKCPKIRGHSVQSATPEEEDSLWLRTIKGQLKGGESQEVQRSNQKPKKGGKFKKAQGQNKSPLSPHLASGYNDRAAETEYHPRQAGSMKKTWSSRKAHCILESFNHWQRNILTSR